MYVLMYSNYTIQNTMLVNILHCTVAIVKVSVSDHIWVKPIIIMYGATTYVIKVNVKPIHFYSFNVHNNVTKIPILCQMSCFLRRRETIL